MKRRLVSAALVSIAGLALSFGSATAASAENVSYPVGNYDTQGECDANATWHNGVEGNQWLFYCKFEDSEIRQGYILWQMHK